MKYSHYPQLDDQFNTVRTIVTKSHDPVHFGAVVSRDRLDRPFRCVARERKRGADPSARSPVSGGENRYTNRRLRMPHM